ncbi:MAG: Protein transport protein S9 plasma membrane t-SNARE [Icmadophila ericetorum]|nr:Protein transport protein S9 plasma membrane t-SNARE [Icmadophila ericetorum]
MKKFGFGKKDESGEDSNRLALFGSRSKSKSPAPGSENPYANSKLAANPYTQAKQNLYAAPAPAPSNDRYGAPPAGRGYGGDSKSAAYTTSGYGASTGQRYGGNSTSPAPTAAGGNKYMAGSGAPGAGGYGTDRYGAQSGYGTDRYGASAGGAAQNGASRYGAGGYGGLGGAGAYDQEADQNRDALFGGAKDRMAQKPQQPKPNAYGQPPPYDEHQGQSADPYAPGSNPGYGSTYGDRQLTAEEEEEEEVSASKQQIRFMKQEDVSSTRNALRIAQQAEETGMDTLARLGAQGEHIFNTEKNLDLAHNQNKLAEEKARELKTLNRSMFAVHVSNPFTSASREKARNQAVIEKHLDEREQREAHRRAEYQANQRLQQSFKELQPGDQGYGKPRGKNLADRAKYQFEADSEDEEMENEIDTNLDLLGGAAGRLNALARATGGEVDEQNKHLHVISDKASLRVWDFLYLSF